MSTILPDQSLLMVIIGSNYKTHPLALKSRIAKIESRVKTNMKLQFKDKHLLSTAVQSSC